MKTESLESRLERALEISSGAVIPVGNASLPLFVGSRANHMRFVADFGKKTTGISRTRGMDVVWSDDERYVHLVSERVGFDPAFAALCRYIVDEVEKVDGIQEERIRFVESILEFQELLRGLSSKLTRESARGWFAELLVLELLLENEIEPTRVMHAWQGPYGGQKDFVFGNSIAIEVKSSALPARDVKISGADQLEPGGLDLFLVVVPLAPSVDQLPSSRSLLDLYLNVERLVQAGGAEATELWQQAVESKISIDAIKEYDFRFECGTLAWFRVEDGFPRILPAAVPPGVTGVTYNLSLSAISNFTTNSPLQELFHGSN